MKIATKFQAFKTQTGLDGDPDKRGSKLKVVDAAFKSYEKGFDHASQQGQILLTTNLFIECKNWLQAKEHKSSVKTGFLKVPKPNQNLLKRRTVIKDLAEECLTALAQMDPSLLARTQFDLHKVRSLATGDRMHNAKTLSGGYHLEREAWLASNKTRAIAASGLHGGVSNLKNPKKKKLTDLNLQDYQRLHSIVSGGNHGMVQYIKKAERLDRMIVLNDQSLLCSVSAPTSPLSLSNVAFPSLVQLANGFIALSAKFWPYAMDSYGNLFSSPEGADDGSDFFNHSSFNAGREVTSAGLLYIEGGFLRWIDNNSGHYKPSADNVRNCLKFLAADGADVSGTVVGIGVYDPVSGALVGTQCFLGQDFIDNGPRQATELLRL